jgi:sec-independent protein translocase protein TatA
MNPVFFALFGDIGGPELLVVFAAILLLFGGKRLPSIARQMGRMVEDLRKTSQEFKNQLLHADEELDTLASDPDNPVPKPSDTVCAAPREPHPLTPGPPDAPAPSGSPASHKESPTRDASG